uniref:Uncharacterized protein n=1 Tax=Rhizophora mucronata TaxID=61149 RepID=A0A2P2QB58_RHIMU
MHYQIMHLLLSLISCKPISNMIQLL